MNKDIYSILNSTKNENTECEQLNDMEVNNIMKRFNSENKTKTGHAKKKIVAVASAAIAAAACLAVFIAVPTLKDAGDISGNSKNTAYHDNSAGLANNSFFISANAAEAEPPEKLYISQGDGNGGCIPYSGEFFFVNGTNIKNVTVSIDKGALYKADYKVVSNPANADSDSAEYIGNEHTEPYNENRCYGFYFSEESYNKHEQECDGYMPKAWHMCYDDFNGAKLVVSVEYLDGQTDSVTHTLRSGMLEIDTETMEPNGNISDGSTPYRYGIYFE